MGEASTESRVQRKLHEVLVAHATVKIAQANTYVLIIGHIGSAKDGTQYLCGSARVAADIKSDRFVGKIKALDVGQRVGAISTTTYIETRRSLGDAVGSAVTTIDERVDASAAVDCVVAG